MIITTLNTTFIRSIKIIPSISANANGTKKAYFASKFLQISVMTQHIAKDKTVAGMKTKIETIIPPTELTQIRITVYIPKNNPFRYRNTRVTYLNFVK
ncbi:MAG: hypothetical protein K2K38_01400 [Clostridia bacterium]|nr:hypothetical protein [Clostridia bacterium]